MAHIVIVGNGIAGVSTARNIRKISDDRISIISSETSPFYARTALKHVYLKEVLFEHTHPYEDWFWKKNDIELLQDHVIEIKPKSNTLLLAHLGAVQYDKLVLATGSTSVKLNIPGSEFNRIQSLYSKNDLDLLEINTATNHCKNAVVVGGGLIGFQMVEMLLSRSIQVTFIVRENKLLEYLLSEDESNMLFKHLEKYGVDVKLNTEIKEFFDDGNGCVGSVLTNHDELIPCDFVGVCIGVKPNINFLKNSGIESRRGILVDDYLLTNIPNIYAAGACVEIISDRNNKGVIIAQWQSGKQMGSCLAQTLSGHPKVFVQGNTHLLTSFLKLTYQKYGTVSSDLSLPSQEEHFYWKCENEELSLRIAFDTQSNKIMGISVIGLKLRSDLVLNWIKKKKTLKYALTHLSDALYLGEFAVTYTEEIIRAYNKMYNGSLKAKTFKWKRVLKLSNKYID